MILSYPNFGLNKKTAAHYGPLFFYLREFWLIRSFKHFT